MSGLHSTTNSPQVNSSLENDSTPFNPVVFHLCIKRCKIASESFGTTRNIYDTRHMKYLTMTGSVKEVTVHAFPFDHVIITFPDAAAAHTAELGPIPSLITTQPMRYRSVRFTATADPYDARVGSGGGTAAAIYDHSSLIIEPTSSDESIQTNRLNETVLILHAGGAASRCPTQMCLGKAWTSLPSFGTSKMSSEPHEESENPKTRSLYTPLHVWLDICQRIFGGDGTNGNTLPPGSVVVVASDTLLQLEDDRNGRTNNSNVFGDVDWLTELQDRNTVLGLAVPAPLSTAKNHGVFVAATVKESTNNIDTAVSTIRITPCRTVLQKPSVQFMESVADCCFTDPTLSTSTTDTACSCDEGRENERMAWIDTGVTVFSPLAAYTLYELTRQHLQRCTSKGLKNLHDKQLKDSLKNSNHQYCTTSDLATFASQTAMPVDLYTHFLQALALSDETVKSQTERKEIFIQAYAKELPTEVIHAIWKALSSCTLQILAVPNARFWHLGTTAELHNFLVDACSDNTATATIGTRSYQCQTFGSQLGLTRRLRAYTKLGVNRNGASCVDATAVIYDSILSVHHTDSYDNKGGTESFIGSKSVIEHCNINTKNGYVHIGANCLVSGLRTPTNVRNQTSWHIPDNFVIQMIQLSTKVTTEFASPAVILAFHMNDDIKKRSTIYGRSVESFLRHSRLQESDIWDTSSSSSQSIWTAKIHPVICMSNNESFASVFSWLRHLDALNDGTDTLEDDVSFFCWKNCQRLSLSEIRDVSDAAQEFVFRNEIMTKHVPKFMSEYIQSIQTMLCERQHSIPIDFQFLVDGYICVDPPGQSPNHNSIRDVIDTVQAMDCVIRENINRDGSRDISARAAMLLGGLFDDIVASAPNMDVKEDPKDRTDRWSLISTTLLGSLDRNEMNEALDAYNNLASIRDENISTKQLSKLTKIARVMEDLASILTGLHIRAAGGIPKAAWRGSSSTIYNQWVVATAPARIDLSGGWSDTPPICYEFGSTVTGMAVRIDHKKPLLCRCRVVLGGTGILLRTEHRDIEHGELLSEFQMNMSSFDGFQNYRDPTSDCALLKCVLVHLGFVPTHDHESGPTDFQTALNQFCGCDTSSVRLEVVATSVLPHGSGLGTSSILAGCILASVGKCVGIGNVSSSSLSDHEYMYDMIDSVLNVEQYLTTGGGFQDQVNGLFGGLKVSSSVPNVHPMKITVDTLSISPGFQNELNHHIYLVYTGTTRLAKNLLQQVLNRWSKQTPEIIETIHGLVDGAAKCRDAIESSDLDGIGQCVSDYWTYKKVMAGPQSGVEPPIVTNIVQCLQEKQLIRGASLCGAGGGGFMVLIAAPGRTSSSIMTELQSTIQNDPRCDTEAVHALTWHTCQVCTEGLSVKVLSNDISLGTDYFTIDWLSPL